MRGMWNGLGLLLALLMLAGCRSTDQHLRPPKAPEVLDPVPDDPRYLKAPQPPAETMKRDYNRKKDDDPGLNGMNGGRPGMRPPGS